MLKEVSNWEGDKNNVGGLHFIQQFALNIG